MVLVLLGTVQLSLPEWPQCPRKLTRHSACLWKLWPQQQLWFGFLYFIYKKYLQFTSSHVSKAIWILVLAHGLGNFAYANTSIFFRQFSAFREQGQILNFSASVITVMYPLSSKQLFNVFQPGLKISHKSQNNRQILIITTSVRRSQFYGEGVTETLRFLWCFPFFFFFPEKIASW